MQLRHFLLHGEIANHPIIFRLHLMLFDDRIGLRGILHLCGRIQQLLDLCAFACIVGINGFRSIVFQLVQHPEPQGTKTWNWRERLSPHVP